MSARKRTAPERRRGPRLTRRSRELCPAVHAASDAGSAAVAPSAPVAATSLATLLTRHLLRDGEIVLLVLKPSLWFLLFNTLPAAALALIVAIGTRLWAPHHVHVGIEAALMLVACGLAWAVLSWTGRLYLLTDQRIVRIWGVFNPQICDCPLRKVARARLICGLHERIWRLGSIQIIPECEQWPVFAWQTIASPRPVHETVARAIARAKQGGCGNGR